MYFAIRYALLIYIPILFIVHMCTHIHIKRNRSNTVWLYLSCLVVYSFLSFQYQYSDPTTECRPGFQSCLLVFFIRAWPQFCTYGTNGTNQHGIVGLMPVSFEEQAKAPSAPDRTANFGLSSLICSPDFLYPFSASRRQGITTSSKRGSRRICVWIPRRPSPLCWQECCEAAEGFLKAN